MDRITLEINRDEEFSSLRYISDWLSGGGVGASLNVASILLRETLCAFKPKAFQYIRCISIQGDSINDWGPNEIWFDYRTSFVNPDFVDANDSLTPLGKYLEDGGGLLDDYQEPSYDMDFQSMLHGQYWNPEWPMPLRIRLDWECAEPPFDLMVVCAADDDMLVHLILHKHIESILEGMRPILEEFVNRKVQEVLKEASIEALETG